MTGDFTDTGTGYAVPAYADGRFTDGGGHHPDDGDYPAGDEYLRYDEPMAGPDDRGYPDRDGWFEDTGVHGGWAEGDDSGFLPGMEGTPDTAGGGPGERRARTAAAGAAAARAPASRAPAGQDPAGQGRAGRARASRAGQGAASVRAAFAGGRHGWP